MTREKIDEEQSIDEYRILVAEYQKEIQRLQRELAKRRVAYESEIARLNAEHEEALKNATAPSLVLNFPPGTKPSDGMPANQG